MIVAFTHSSTSVPGFASWTSQASFSYTATESGGIPLQAVVCEYATSARNPKASVTVGSYGYTGTGEAVGYSVWSQTRGRGGILGEAGEWASNSGEFMYSKTGNNTNVEVVDTCSLVPIIPGVGQVCQPCGHFSQVSNTSYNRYTLCPNVASITRIGIAGNTLNGETYYTYLDGYCSPKSCGPIPYDTGNLNRSFFTTQSAPIPNAAFRTSPVDVAITLQDSHTLKQIYGKDAWFSRMGGPSVVEAPWPIAGSVNISDTNRVEAATTLTTTYTGFVSALTANRTTQNNSNIPDFGATGLDVAIGTLSSAVSTITRTVGIPESRTFEYKTKAYQGVSFTTPPVVDENLDGFPDYQNPCTNFVISGGTGWAYDNTNFHVPLAGYSGIHNRMGRKKEDVYVGSYHVSTSSGNFLSQPPAWTTGSILAPLLITSTQNLPGDFSMPSVVTDPIGFAVGPFITVSGLSGWYTIDSPPTVFGTITTGQPQTITTANFDGTGTAETIITKFSTSSTTAGATRVPAQIVSFPGTGGWAGVSANALGAAWQTVATIDVSLAGNEPCQYPAFFSRELSILTTRASGWSLSQTRTASGETLNSPYTLWSAYSGASSTRGATAGFLGETYFGIPKFVGNNSNYAVSVTRPFIVSQSEIVKAITYETFIDTGLLPQNWSLSISSRSSVSSLASLGHHTSSDWLGNPGPMVNLKARWGQTAYSANDNVASITNNIYARDSMLTTSEFPRASEFISASLVNSACPSAGIFVLRTSIERVAETDFIYREWIGHASAPAYMTIQGGIPPSGGSATPSSFLTDYKCGQLTLVACIRATGQEETFTNIRHGAMSSPPPFGTFLLHNALGVSSDGNLSSGTFKVSEWQNVFTNNWYATSQARAYPDANDFSQGMFWLDQTGGAAGMCAIVVSRSAAVPLVHSRLDMIYHPVAPVFHNFVYWNNSAYTPVIFADQGGTADGIYPNERMIGPNAWQPERKFGAVGIGVEPLPEPPGGGGGGGGDGGGGGGGGGDGGGGGGGGGGGSYEE